MRLSWRWSLVVLAVVTLATPLFANDDPKPVILSLVGSSVDQLAISPDGKSVFTVNSPKKSGEPKVWRWEVATGKRTEIVTGAGVASHPLVLDSGKNLLLRCTDRDEEQMRRYALVWDLEKNKEFERLNGDWNVRAVSPDSSLWLTPGEGGMLSVWHRESGKRLHEWEVQRNRSPQPVAAFSSDSKRIALVSTNNVIWTCDIATGKKVEGFLRETGRPSETDTVQALAYSPDGGTLAALIVSQPSCVLLRDLATGRERLVRRDKGSHESFFLKFTADGKQLLVGDQTDGLDVWDLKTDQRQVRFQTQDRRIRQFVASADGRRVAAFDANSPDVYVWDIPPPKAE